MCKKFLFNSLFPIANVQLREDGVIRFDNKAQVDQPYLITQFEHGGFGQTKPRGEKPHVENISTWASPRLCLVQSLASPGCELEKAALIYPSILARLICASPGSPL